MRRETTIGILGGMGPWATHRFWEVLLRRTAAKREADHLRVVVDSHPRIPSRTRHFLYNEASPVPGMLDVCRRLARYPVDVIAIPCNSACHFLPKFAGQVPVPILDIITATATAAARRFPGGQLAVLGGAITFGSDRYRAALTREGAGMVCHDEARQARVEELIANLKLRPRDPELAAAYAALVDEVRAVYAPDGVILACTELSFVAEDQVALPTIDSTTELALETLRFAQLESST